ncbi:FAD-binding oxidoreductase [Pseudonocardia pini]|uniref:FAD-binding oxidoreductase n=1 Tax=Pseudonocardia pini TaxID=2758030 RepID=UPI0028A78F03|nr:FAD-binding oxidoreductase [Pseudonocardia pini]
MVAWQKAMVVEVRRETPNAKTFRLKLPAVSEHVAGQYYVLRLTAEDGYTAQRDYSVASVPGSDLVDLTVELLPGGEVSEFLHEVVEPGDELEVRGPIGGWFAWRGDSPALGVAGGSGVVPLMSMLRLSRLRDPSLFRLVVSARRPADLYYGAEVVGPQTTVVYTRQTPPSWPRPVGRLTADDLAPTLTPTQTVYVCGTPPFCDHATGLLESLGVSTDRIRVERFGPS